MELVKAEPIPARRSAAKNQSRRASSGGRIPCTRAGRRPGPASSCWARGGFRRRYLRGPGRHRRRSPAGGARLFPATERTRHPVPVAPARRPGSETPMRRMLAWCRCSWSGRCPPPGVAVPLAPSRGAGRRRAPPRRAASRIPSCRRVYVRAGSVSIRRMRRGSPNLTAELLTRGTARACPSSIARSSFVGGRPRVGIRARREHPDPLRAAEGPRSGASISSPKRCLRPPSPRTSCGRKVSTSRPRSALEENPEAVGGARSPGCSTRDTRMRTR